jgi:NAD(P)-dependent dehydrogenase (short-subunit alcohol dehydrogenase family)
MEGKMGILDNKVAVITGSSRGLGLAIAKAYAAEGAAVVLTARSARAIESAVEEIRGAGGKASGLPCDVGALEQVEALRDHAVQTFGHIDIWVNNAGVAGVYGPTAHIPTDSFERVVQTNILGTYYGSVVALRYFLPRHRGKLINLLGRGDTGPVRFQNAYTASKAWVRSFTKALAMEYKDSGVSVFAFNPGLVDTDMMHRIESVQGYEKRLKPLETVMRMWSNPPEVPAQKALWLASAETDGKTGLEVKVLDRSKLIGGLLKDIGRRLTRQPGASRALDITTVPPAVKEQG